MMLMTTTLKELNSRLWDAGEHQQTVLGLIATLKFEVAEGNAETIALSATLKEAAEGFRRRCVKLNSRIRQVQKENEEARDLREYQRLKRKFEGVCDAS